MRKVKLALTLSIMLLSPLGFAQESVLGDRANVMECSHDEVVAYMELPNPERKAMSDFHLWQSAYQSTESKKSGKRSPSLPSSPLWRSWCVGG